MNTLQYLRQKYDKAGISRTELSIELGVSLPTIDRRISEGKNIPRYKKIGGCYFFPLFEVARYIEEDLVEIY